MIKQTPQQRANTIEAIKNRSFSPIGYSSILQIFGDENIDRCKGGHPADEGYTGPYSDLLNHRLKWLLENSEVVE